MSCSGPIYSKYLALLYKGDFEGVIQELNKIDHEDRLAYLFLVKEIYEEFNCLQFDEFKVKQECSRFHLMCAMIRCLYRTSTDIPALEARIEEAKLFYDGLENKETSLFWYLHLLMTEGFIHHSKGNFEIAEQIYKSIYAISEDEEFHYLTLSAKISLLEIYFEKEKNEEFQKTREELQIFFTQIPNSYFEGVYEFVCAEQEHRNGKYYNALNLLKSAYRKFENIKQKSYEARVCTRLGKINQELGNIEEAQENFERSIELLSGLEGRFSEKAILYESLAHVRSVLGYHEEAWLLLDKAQAFLEVYNQPDKLATLYFSYVEIGSHANHVDIVEEYVDKLRELTEKTKTDQILNLYKLALVHKMRQNRRAKDLVESQNILYDLLKKSLPFRHRIYTYHLLLEMLLKEFSLFHIPEIANEINETFSALIQQSEKFPSKWLNLQILLLRARFAVTMNKVSEAEGLIRLAEDLANEWNIPLWIKYVNSEKKKLIQKAKAFELFSKSFERTDLGIQVTHSELLEYIDRVKDILRSMELR